MNPSTVACGNADSASLVAQRRVPELDGIRGIAIVAVLLYHLSPPMVEAINKLPVSFWKVAANVMIYPISNFGWVGVDLFFVLSGYLITGILLKTKASPRYFENFYARRILRIFPIYYLSLLFLLVIFPWFHLVVRKVSVYREQVFYWLYLQNWAETFRGYTGFQSGFLGPTWSLAVEEQFYLFWPLVVYLLKPRRLFATALFLIVFSLLLRCVVNVYAGGFEAYSLINFNLFTRFDTLAFGALIAYAEHQSGGRLALLEQWAYGLNGVLISLISFLGAIVYFRPEEPQVQNVLVRTVGYTIIAAICTLLLVKALVDRPNSWWRKILRNPGLVYCGGISYGLYIFHMPVYYVVFDCMKKNQASFTYPAWSLGITFGLAFLSFRFFETPILHLKRYFENPDRMLIKGELLPGK